MLRRNEFRFAYVTYNINIDVYSVSIDLTVDKSFSRFVLNNTLRLNCHRLFRIFSRQRIGRTRWEGAGKRAKVGWEKEKRKKERVGGRKLSPMIVLLTAILSSREFLYM